MQSSFVFQFFSTPYGSTKLREGLEALFACAAFELPAAAVFREEAIACFLPNHEVPEGHKSMAKFIASMPLYGIENVFVVTTDLTAFSLCDKDLPDFVDAVTLDKLDLLLRQSACVLNY